MLLSITLLLTVALLVLLSLGDSIDHHYARRVHERELTKRRWEDE